MNPADMTLSTKNKCCTFEKINIFHSIYPTKLSLSLIPFSHIKKLQHCLFVDGKPYTSLMYANGPGFELNQRKFTDPNGTVYKARVDLSDDNENQKFRKGTFCKLRTVLCCIMFIFE